MKMLTNIRKRLSRIRGQRLPEHPSKKFSNELEKINLLLERDIPFSFSRFGDGEMMIIEGSPIDLSQKENGEHKYEPNAAKDELQRELLFKALTYSKDNYIVGISCPCCVGIEKFEQLKRFSNQKEKNLTWATLFVNSNFQDFRKKTVPIISSKEQIYFIGHEKGNVENLPFKVKKHFKSGGNAWINDYARLEKDISQELTTIEGAGTFIFCAGVLSNLLIYTLSKNFPQHTYLDCGSVFDVDLGLGKTRKYLKNGKTLRRTCVWA